MITTVPPPSAVAPAGPDAARRPPRWPGWPAHKQFALVLTHDVAGPVALARHRRLATLEADLGFRSAFYFSPDDPPAVSAPARAWLQEHGFEVGVLARPPAGFWSGLGRNPRAHADHLNQLLRAWRCAGIRFTAPPRDPGWMHRLEIEYDSSLAEPGAGAVFPRCVDPAGGEGSRSYIELPQTLTLGAAPSTGPAEPAWAGCIRRFDELANAGGLVLVNLPAARVTFFNDTRTEFAGAAAAYQALLLHIREKFGGLAWPALPCQLAARVRALPSRPPPARRRRIAMLTHSFYESDGRVIRYAESLARRGDHVEVFALRRDPALPEREVLGGVTLHRLQPRYHRSSRSRWDYLWPLLRFFAVSAWELTRRQLRAPYDLVHVHNIPDFLVFAAWFPRWRGAAVILDIHDMVPELYGSKFEAVSHGRTLAALKWIERCSARFATGVIVSNDLWLEKFAARTGTAEKCSVFINHVDGRTFRPGLRTRHDDRLIVMFPGGLQWHQGLDLALHAFRRVSAELPQAEFHIYGDGDMRPSLVALAAELGLGDKVRFFAPVGAADIAGIMANADVGVVPKRADSFGNEAYSTKIMEFMSLGVPVVVSGTRIDRFYFDDSVVRFFESGNSADLAAALLVVLRDAAARQRMVARALDYSRRHGWESRQADYLKLVDRLVSAPCAA